MAKHPYQDAALPVNKRVEDLLSRMTLDEKFAQMRTITQVDELLGGEPFSDEKVQPALKNGLGASYSAYYMDPAVLNQFQRFLMEKTRLGIPLIMMSESLHGVMSTGATVFPQAIGLSSSWNPDLIARVADAAGGEARALGITQTFAPNLDLSREPRWGRVEENYGEDPYLTSRMGVAYVKALQNRGVAATLKHYVAHGSPESGINLAPVHAGERELRDTFLVPFAAAIREGGAMSIMPAYSELDGVPVSASRFLLTDILRGELGFDGHCVSDFGAVHMLYSMHRTAADAVEAGKQTLWAGMDLEAPTDFGFGDGLMEAVRAGTVDIALIDQAVARILSVKFRLGLFENPYADLDAVKEIHGEEARALAREAARETVVLLKNDGLLPLESPCRVAVIGPNADVPQLGDYTPKEASDRAVSVLAGLKARLGDAVTYARGCTIAGGTDEELRQAVEAARGADVAVVVLGDNSNFFGGVGWGEESSGSVVTCGEGFDRSELGLPGRQQQLLEAVAATGTPVALVLMNGRPLSIPWAKEHIPAILEAWYPGEEGGNAVADLLFGDANPSARLTVTFPQSAGHVPCFYNYKPSARGFYHVPGSPEKPGRDYVFASPDPLFPFGWGLSYTTFEYTDLAVSPGTVAAGGSVTVSVTVKNTGERRGKEVVQLYLTDLFSRLTTPVKALKGFAKVNLMPGESRRVSFTLDADAMAFINERLVPEVEPGVFRVAVGELTAEFTVV